MKLKCTIGSISCDGILAEKGDIFEVSDEAGRSIIASGYASEYHEPAPAETDDTSDTDPTTDITEMDPGDDTPNETWAVADIKTWLDTMDIGYPLRASKTGLLELIPDLDA